ncbi:unnamed protein product, partial [Phaeothamnion confervicola]
PLPDEIVLPDQLELRVSPKILIGAAICFSATGAFIWFASVTGPAPWAAAAIGAAVIAFALGAIRLMMLAGMWGGLRLRRDGFDYRYLFFRERRKWSECSEFKAEVRPVVVSRASDSGRIAIPDFYSLDRDELAVLMNRFRTRAQGAA